MALELISALTLLRREPVHALSPPAQLKHRGGDMQDCHRIMESLSLEKTSQTIESNQVHH